MNPYAIIGALLVLIATAFGGVQAGKKLERQVWQAERISMLKQHTEEVAGQFRQYDSDVKLQQAKARKASKDHDHALQLLDQKHRDAVADIRRLGGLRIPVSAACRTKAAPAAESPGPRGPDEADAETIRLPAGIEDDLFRLAQRADTIVEQCRALQTWIIDNGHYGQTE